MTESSTPNYMLPLVGFKSRKAAQIAAFFALKSHVPNDGTIEKLKLIKLIYLSEREFLSEHHFPMLFDELYSLPHGPICSGALNGIDGFIHEDVWSEFIARNGNIVVAVKRFVRNDFDEISEAEMNVLEKIWAKFGSKTASQLRNYSHTDCPEYTETSGRIPISYKEVFEALGIEEADEIDGEIRDMRRAQSALQG